MLKGLIPISIKLIIIMGITFLIHLSVSYNFKLDFLLIQSYLINTFLVFISFILLLILNKKINLIITYLSTIFIKVLVYFIFFYPIDQFIAFKACIELHKEKGTYDSITKKIYNKCVEGFKKNISEEKNNVKDFYKPFSHQEISRKIAAILKSNKINADLDIIFQEVDSLHKACPDNLGDWYFTGDYPTPGGNRVVNRAFINFYEGKSQRAY